MEEKKLEELKDEAIEEVAGGIAGLFPNAPSITKPLRPAEPGEGAVPDPPLLDEPDGKTFPLKHNLKK